MPDDSNPNRILPTVAGQPHQVPWFWRMMGMYNRQTHNVMLDLDAGEQDLQSQEQAQQWWQRQFKIAGNRTERYRIFEEMDGNGLITSILDLLCEETCQPDYEKQRMIWIESQDHEMVKAGEECLRNIMAEDKLPPIVRRFCKYGDAFQRMIYGGGKGVMGWQYCPSDKVHRVDDKYGRLVGFRQDSVKFRAKTREVSWPWDYVHFRLLGKDEETGYGTSYLDSLFQPWRQLTLAEDAVLMYRMRRAPDRNLILVDVGNMEEAEAMDYVNQFKKRFRKYEFIDPASPQYRKQYNPMTPMEDIFLPMRGDSNATRVESLTGAGNSDQIFDINYFNQKFFGASKVPKAYMGFEGDINAKATLQQQDIRFARTCKKLQKTLIYGVRQVLDMHFTMLSDGGDKFDFSKVEKQYLVKMSPISFLDEMERLELVQLRSEVIAASAQLGAQLKIDEKVWSTYILLNYAKLPEDVALRLLTGENTADAAAAALAPPLQPGQPAVNPVTAANAPVSETVGRYGRFRKMTPLGESRNWKGFYQLNGKEKDAIAEMVHRSPRLRQIIGDIHESHIHDRANYQSDPSLLPPMRGGVEITDGVVEAPEIVQLKEDLAALDTPDGKKLLTEGVEAPVANISEGAKMAAAVAGRMAAKEPTP